MHAERTNKILFPLLSLQAFYRIGIVEKRDAGADIDTENNYFVSSHMKVGII